MPCFFGTACTVFASLALHGLLGLKNIPWPLLLALVQLRGRPAKVDVSA